MRAGQHLLTELPAPRSSLVHARHLATRHGDGPGSGTAERSAS
jgi:hypothetical protein